MDWKKDYFANIFPLSLLLWLWRVLRVLLLGAHKVRFLLISSSIMISIQQESISCNNMTDAAIQMILYLQG
jgi:hypothetical protein